MAMQQISVSLIFLGLILALIFSNKRPATVFTIALLGLLITNSVNIESVVTNASNHAVLSLLLLLIISSVIERTQILRRISRLLIRPTMAKSYFRIFSLTALASAFLNNTAVVASLLSNITNNNQHPASKLLIPLSFAAILGGTITLIGTSTNLIVNSFLIQETGNSFAFFEFLLFGLAATVSCGILLFVLLPLLPKHEAQTKNRKDYFIEAKVTQHSQLIGKSVSQNQLRNLGDLFLVEIVRNKSVMSPVNPQDVIEAGDKLIFSGDIKHVELLQQFNGLELFAESDGLLQSNLVEVVISNRSMLINKSLKSIGFRARFDAAVVAMRRDGEQISGKLGEIILRAGDILVLATGTDFTSRENLTKNFFFLSDLQLPKQLTSVQEWLIPAGFIAALSAAAIGWLSLLEALFFLLAGFGLGRIINSNDVKRKLPLDLWLIITASLTLATAIQNADLEIYIAQWIEPIAALNEPFYAIVLIFILTVLFTELVTNNAAAALMYPIALGISHSLQIDIIATSMTVALAASASFISPYSYQTNLMILNAGRYRLADFVKVGIPISVCYSITVLTLINYFYF